MPEQRGPAGGSRIVFDGRYINDRYHGIGRYGFHLLSELAAGLPTARFRVLRDPSLPDTRFDWASLQARPNVEFREVAARPFAAAEQWRIPAAQLSALLQTQRSGGHYLYHSPYFALPWLQAGPGLVTVHDCIFERDSRYMPRRWARSYYRLVVLYSVRRGRAVFVPSRATAADVRRFYRVPARKLVVTPEAADPSFRPLDDRPTLEAVRARYSLPSNFVLAVGARRPHKNFAILVKAISRVEAGRLVFVGEADERFRDEAREEAVASGADNVRFLGNVPETDLVPLYNLSTAVAVPSRIEGFGLPVLEAMSSGTPVICSDIPVLREVAGDAALLAAPDDVEAWSSGLSRLFGDPALRARLRDAGLKRAAGFTWKRTAEAVAPVYGAEW